MAVKVDMNAVNEAYDKSNEGFSGGQSTYKVPPDSTVYLGFMPPHENMNRLPYKGIMQHQRELPDGVQGDFAIRCQRDDIKDDPATCFGCRKSRKHYKLSEEKGDKHSKQSQRFQSSRKKLSQVVDLTPLYKNAKGKDRKKPKSLKKCFGKYDQMPDCDDCFLAESCSAGVQPFFTPYTVWDALILTLKTDGDVTDFDNLIPMMVVRTGKTKTRTKYSAKSCMSYAMELPKGIQKRLDAQIIDLDEYVPKPTGSKEELDKTYKDFFTFADIQDDDDDDDLPEVTPKKSGKKKDKKGKKAAKKSGKKKDKKGKKGGKGKKDVDDVRAAMEKKSKKGKMNK